MNVSDKRYGRDNLNPEVRRSITRKGGRRRVKKGFAKTLTSEKASEYVKKRWAKYNSPGTDTKQEERKADS